MLSPELVEYLNREGNSAQSNWLEKNPVIGNFVTCPTINIRPSVIPQARRISALDDITGRRVHIAYDDGSHRHIIKVACDRVTVESIHTLIREVESINGTCHVERTYLVLYVPSGYYLSVSQNGMTQIMLVRDLDSRLALI